MYTAHIDTLPLVVTAHALIADLSALLPRRITYQHRDGQHDRKSWWWWRRGAPPDMDPPGPWTPTKINTAPDPAHDTVRNIALVSNNQV